MTMEAPGTLVAARALNGSGTVEWEAVRAGDRLIPPG